ncbi:MAG TPA: hypothetical protein VN634_15880 [Candidatus Limnocylindrales bacterium]|nr:hypothetical protein [Candidatus Limnocylindrales bacterium]
MIESTAGRVPSNTSRDVNLEIKEAFRASVAYFTEHPTAIPHRLKMLDQEWDIERALAMASSGFSLAGLLAGFSGRRRGFVLSLIVQGFYMQHTLQGWCPPLPVLRRMGFRTASEIERERCALKDILREDNAELTQSGIHHPAEKFGISEKDASRPI